MDEDLAVDVGQLPSNQDRGTRRSVMQKLSKTYHRAKQKVTTRHGLIGDYDYLFLIKPNLPFMKKKKDPLPFYGVNDEMPVFLGILLGVSHALAMICGVAAPPLIMGSTANLPDDRITYMVSCSLICSGFLSMLQISRFHIYKTPYYFGTGLLSIVGTSFATITIATTGIPQMYKNGYCPTADDGTKLPCPQAFEAILGTSCVCALLQILISFCPPRILQRMFPPVVTGPVVLLIGVNLIASGMADWGGGSGDCMARPTSGPYQLCPNVDAPHALPWGSAEFIGLGFSVFITIVICERFGAPLMRSSSIIIGLVVGCIIAAATGYFDRTSIDSAPVIIFLWVDAFNLKVYAPIVLPMLAVYLVCVMEGIGDITATCDVSRQEVTGKVYETRIQGGLLTDGINSILAALANNAPMTTFAQNNGVIAMTKCANRTAGIWGCVFLLIVGIFAKVSAAIVAIPKPVLGGLTTFLFTAVVVSGMSIITSVEFTGRNRFVLTCSCMFGLAATLVPKWFSYVFTYEGDNTGLHGIIDAVELVCETGFALAGFVGVIMNLILPTEFELFEGTGNDNSSRQSLEEDEKNAAVATTTATTNVKSD